MSRTFGTILGAYLGIGIVRTIVVEVYSFIQGSSTLGLLSGPSPADVKFAAVYKTWLLPIVTWPLEILDLAMRQMTS